MTQEEKELLLKDLGARLQYKLHCRVFRLNGDIKENNDILYGIIGDNIITLKSNEDECLMYYQIKPYLRPMSSMTEEERNELSHYDNSVQRTDFFYSHHIDCRFMIEKGLALEAHEGMYNN